LLALCLQTDNGANTVCAYPCPGATPADLAATSGHTELSNHLRAVTAGTEPQLDPKHFLKRAQQLDMALHAYTGRLDAALAASTAQQDGRLSGWWGQRPVSLRAQASSVQDAIQGLLPPLLQPAGRAQASCPVSTSSTSGLHRQHSNSTPAQAFTAQPAETTVGPTGAEIAARAALLLAAQSAVLADPAASCAVQWQHITTSQQPIAEGIEEGDADLACILAEGTNKAAAVVLAAVRPASGCLPAAVAAAEAAPIAAPYANFAATAADAVFCFSSGHMARIPDSSLQSAASALPQRQDTVNFSPWQPIMSTAEDGPTSGDTIMPSTAPLLVTEQPTAEPMQPMRAAVAASTGQDTVVFSPWQPLAATARAGSPAAADDSASILHSALSTQAAAQPGKLAGSGKGIATGVPQQQKEQPQHPALLSALWPLLTDNSWLRGWEGQGSQGTQLVATVPLARPLSCVTQVSSTPCKQHAIAEDSSQPSA
jgi:hypothetical protein